MSSYHLQMGLGLYVHIYIYIYIEIGEDSSLNHQLKDSRDSTIYLNPHVLRLAFYRSNHLRPSNYAKYLAHRKRQ